MHTFFNRRLTVSVCLAFGGLVSGRAQVQPLPVIPPDALVQTYTGRLAYTLLNGYVRNDDARLSDSRTPNGTAGGDLTGNYPNPTIKASVNLTGNPTATTPATAANNTQIATTAYVKSNLASYVATSDSRLSDSRTPNGTAGGDLTGTYPNPTIKSSVNLSGSPTAPTPATATNSTRIATTAYVKNNLASYVTTSDSRLSDSRTPNGTAGGDLTGDYPNPTIKASVNLNGNPTATTPATAANNTQIATTAYVKNNLANYVTTSDSRLSDSRTPSGTAGGDLTGTYPNPTIKSSVNLSGSPTATTPATATNSTRIATTAYVKNNLASYVTTSDSRLSDSRTPNGTAGGDLSGTYPNPTIKASVNLTGNPTVAGKLTVNGTDESLIKGNLRLKGNSAFGNKLNFGDGDYVYLYEATDDNLTVKAKNIELAPTAAVTAPTPATTDNSTKIATTAYVQNNLSQKLTANFAYVTNSTSQHVYITDNKFIRGGQKENDEPAFVCRLVDKNLAWSSAALVGNTYESVKITNTTSYAGNYIYQMANGKYINLINRVGCLGPNSHVIFNVNGEDFLVREAIWLPSSIENFISNISEFSF